MAKTHFHQSHLPQLKLGFPMELDLSLKSSLHENLIFIVGFFENPSKKNLWQF